MGDGATRLIVKELPKTATEESVLKHVEKVCGKDVLSSLTDCRLIRVNGRSRRMAFLGFKTAGAAQKCKKFADGTFMMTSKLQVADALKEGDPKLPKEWSAITKTKKSKHKEEDEEAQQTAFEQVADTGRLRILNIPYDVDADALMSLCSPFGKVVEVKVPPNKSGMAYVTYAFPPDGVKALAELDKSIFMGRKIRCEPSAECTDNDPIEKVFSARKYQSDAKRAILEKKMDRTKDSQNWNLLYVSASVATDVMAKYLGVEAEDIVDTENTSDSLAARVAIAESHVIAETKKWLASLGLPEEIFITQGNTLLGAKIRAVDKTTPAAGKKSLFSSKTFFVKHLGPWVGDGEELRKLMSRFGHITLFELSPTKTIAVVSYRSSSQALHTFSELALYNFQGRPLYLEYAPRLVDAKLEELGRLSGSTLTANDAISSAVNLEEETGLSAVEPSSTIYVTNIAFETTEAKLSEIFGACTGFRKVTLLKSRKRSRDMSTGAVKELDLSMGHGFAVFDTVEHAQAAMKRHLDLVVDGHALKMDWSRSKTSLSNAPASSSSTKRPRMSAETEKTALVTRKLIIKNLDFTTSEKDIRQLCQTYGTVTSCRLPKRSDGRIRGFGFVEFATVADAAQAMKALCDVRLLGRRLVIQPTEASVAEQASPES